MKKYYYRNTQGFSNTYDLTYTETPEEDEKVLSEGYERITLKEAERLCKAEREREIYDSAFSGYADSVILPCWYPVQDRDWRDDSRMVLNGCVVERV